MWWGSVFVVLGLQSLDCLPYALSKPLCRFTFFNVLEWAIIVEAVEVLWFRRHKLETLVLFVRWRIKL